MNIMNKRFCILLFTLLMVVAVKAQPMLSIEEAVAATLKSNFDIQLLKNDSAVYALNNSYAKAAFWPRVNATTGAVFNHNNQNQKLADGTKRKANNIRSGNINSSVNLNWLVFDGFKMFVTKVKLAEYVKLGDLTIKNQVVNSIAAVINSYYRIVKEKQQLKSIEEQMGINEERVKQAEKKLSVGLGAKPELLQAKLDLNAQKANKLVQQTLIEQVKEDLNQLLGFAQGTLYEVADSIPINKNIIVADVMGTAENSNTDLLVAKQNIQLAQLTLKEKKADRYPTVSLVSAYNFSRANNHSVINPFTPLFSQNYGFNYGISVNIPVFNNYNVKRQIQTAQLDLNYQQLLYNYKKFSTGIAISKAYKNYELQKKTLQLEEENIMLAKENVTIALERNRLGLTTILELRETQKSLEAAYNRLILARYGAKQAETELLRLKGDFAKPE